jgi:hypothetical protein
MVHDTQTFIVTDYPRYVLLFPIRLALDMPNGIVRSDSSRMPAKLTRTLLLRFRILLSGAMGDAARAPWTTHRSQQRDLASLHGDTPHSYTL